MRCRSSKQLPMAMADGQGLNGDIHRLVRRCEEQLHTRRPCQEQFAPTQPSAVRRLAQLPLKLHPETTSRPALCRGLLWRVRVMASTSEPAFASVRRTFAEGIPLP